MPARVPAFDPLGGRIMFAPCPVHARRRIRLFVLLCGALVLASLVPLLVSDGVLIRRNQRRSGDPGGEVPDPILVRGRGPRGRVLRRGAGTVERRRGVAAAGGADVGIGSVQVGPGHPGARVRPVGTVSGPRPAGNQFRGRGKLRRAGRAFHPGRLRIPERVRGGPGRRPLSGTGRSRSPHWDTSP